MPDPIEFQATIAKVQTLADGGIRLTLDLPETAVLQAAHLMEARRQVAVVDASLVPKVIETREDASRIEHDVSEEQRQW